MLSGDNIQHRKAIAIIQGNAAVLETRQGNAKYQAEERNLRALLLDEVLVASQSLGLVEPRVAAELVLARALGAVPAAGQTHE
eukprot:2470804-Rhodomonas_salina.3